MICENYIDRACKINSLFYQIKYHPFLQMDLYKRYNKSLLPNLAEGFFSASVPRWDTCHIKITACDTVTVFTTQIID